jgi:hypothetical protein
MTDVNVPDDDELAAFRKWQQDNASDEAKTLAEAGAKPTTVDADSMLATIRKMQAQLDNLNAERGIPADPIDANIQAIEQHVTQVSNAHPTVDFGELKTAVKDLRSQFDDGLNESHTDYFKATVEDLLHGGLSHLAHELGYIWQLTRGLHREILKNKASAGV